MVTYTDHALVSAVRSDIVAPRYGAGIDGYGAKIATRHGIHYAGRWRRVYVACFSNVGVSFLVHGGRHMVLDTDTEWQLQGVAP